ncbi:hypothetical protein K5D33_12415 [Pseudomonas cichorii]|nr:hypothetical protein [Pseudomonas cichorii]MBX8535508.1 hypothetical protein [Pseudomonas cichorii]
MLGQVERKRMVKSVQLPYMARAQLRQSFSVGLIVAWSNRDKACGQHDSEAVRRVKHFALLELTRFYTPVNPTLDWHQFVSIKGDEFDCQLPK